MKKISTLLFISLSFAGCQQTLPLSDQTPQKPKAVGTDKTTEDKDETEKVTPPTNIAGSYLACIELEQLVAMDTQANIRCAVYTGSKVSMVAVSVLSQWQILNSPATLHSLQTSSASEIELAFVSPSSEDLRRAVTATQVRVVDDQGDLHQGYLVDLLPQESRLSRANTGRSGSLRLLWNEGFEGTRLTTDALVTQDLTSFAMSTRIHWSKLGDRDPFCGAPMVPIMKWANLYGSTDLLGAAEGSQFIGTRSQCWTEPSTEYFCGSDNMTISRNLNLVPGQVYRLSFKVRLQPLPVGMPQEWQALELRINQKTIKDLRTFSPNWVEIVHEWVAGDSHTQIDWIDRGNPEVDFGLLLDDLKVFAREF
jgi:hypothetical protein